MSGGCGCGGGNGGSGGCGSSKQTQPDVVDIAPTGAVQFDALPVAPAAHDAPAQLIAKIGRAHV